MEGLDNLLKICNEYEICQECDLYKLVGNKTCPAYPWKEYFNREKEKEIQKIRERMEIPK